MFEDSAPMSEAYIKKVRERPGVTDLGSVTITSEKEYQMLMKYIECLETGDESYRPEGLVFDR